LGTTNRGDSMSNYDMDEIERSKQVEVSNAPAIKPQNNLPEYPARKGKRLEDAIIKHVSPNQSHIIKGIKQKEHALDERYSSTEGFGRDDQDNIKNVLRNSPKVQSLVDVLKPVQQWDAQTQSYVQVGNSQDDIRSLHENEEVTTPKHYVGLGITPLEYITANELDFIEGNIIKYITRYPHKGGVNDLLKARTYLEKLIEREVEKT
jgi:hypothetical protein